MADLKMCFESLDFSEVSTYIQSGNVFFNSKIIDQIELKNSIETEIFKRFNFNVPVIIRQNTDINLLVKNNPFLKNGEVDINLLYVTFLSGCPLAENLNKLAGYDFKNDKYVVAGKHVFIKYEFKASQSKLTNNVLESNLKTVATSRNWKTLLKLQELSS